jgi:hypothetical protein
MAATTSGVRTAAKPYRAPILVKGPTLSAVTADTQVSGITQDGG